MKPKPLIVLEALLQGEQDIGGYRTGRDVRMNGFTWVLAESETGPVPCVVLERTRNGRTEPMLVGQPDLSLAAFFTMCEALTEEQIAEIGFSTVLGSIAAERTDARGGGKGG